MQEIGLKPSWWNVNSHLTLIVQCFSNLSDVINPFGSAPTYGIRIHREEAWGPVSLRSTSGALLLSVKFGGMLPKGHIANNSIFQWRTWGAEWLTGPTLHGNKWQIQELPVWLCFCSVQCLSRPHPSFCLLVQSLFGSCSKMLVAGALPLPTCGPCCLLAVAGVSPPPCLQWPPTVLVLSGCCWKQQLWKALLPVFLSLLETTKSLFFCPSILYYIQAVFTKQLFYLNLLIRGRI